MPSQPDLLFGKLAVLNRMVTQERIDECIRLQEANRRLGLDLSVGEILVRKGYLTQAQADTVARAQQYLVARREDLRFGALAVRNGFVSRDRIAECLRRQEELFKKNEPFPRIGQVLVEERFVTPQQVRALLAAQARLNSGAEDGPAPPAAAAVAVPAAAPGPVAARAAAARPPLERGLAVAGLTVALRAAEVPDVHVLDVAGALEGPALPALAAYGERLIEAGRCRLVLNCRGVASIAADAAGTLAGLARRARAAGGDLCLAALPTRVRQALAPGGLTRLVRVYDLERGAIASCAPAATRSSPTP